MKAKSAHNELWGPGWVLLLRQKLMYRRIPPLILMVIWILIRSPHAVSLPCWRCEFLRSSRITVVGLAVFDGVSQHMLVQSWLNQEGVMPFARAHDK